MRPFVHNPLRRRSIKNYFTPAQTFFPEWTYVDGISWQHRLSGALEEEPIVKWNSYRSSSRPSWLPLKRYIVKNWNSFRYLRSNDYKPVKVHKEAYQVYAEKVSRSRCGAICLKSAVLMSPMGTARPTYRRIVVEEITKTPRFMFHSAMLEKSWKISQRKTDTTRTKKWKIPRVTVYTNWTVVFVLDVFECSFRDTENMETFLVVTSEISIGTVLFNKLFYFTSIFAFFLYS